MKFTKLLLLVAAVIMFSCGKDDDPQPTVDGLVGKWSISSLDYHGKTTTTVQGTTLASNFTGTGKDMNLTTTFTKNPNTVTSEGSYTIVLTTTTLGQTDTQEISLNEIVTSGTWELKGSTITVTGSNGPQDATILEQTDSTLKLKIEVSQSVTVQGVTSTTEIHGTYTFQKN
jgi:hypothetical protein